MTGRGAGDRCVREVPLPHKKGVHLAGLTQVSLTRVKGDLSELIALNALSEDDSGVHAFLNALATLVRNTTEGPDDPRGRTILEVLEAELQRNDVDPEFANAVSISFLRGEEVAGYAPRFPMVRKLIGNYEARLASAGEDHES